MASEDFAKHMEAVAMAVLPEFMGEPNRHLSTRAELRWGAKGSVAVDLTKGVWHDYEDQSGGGVLDLLKAYKGFEKPEALEWLEERGFIERRERSNGKKVHGINSERHGDRSMASVPDWMEHKPVAAYQYFDDRGRLAYEVLKFSKEAPRRYMQRRRHPSGGWIWGLQKDDYGKTRSGDWFKAKEGKHYDAVEHIDAAERWLYRRDEVLKAKVEGRPIILVEGEKDVETVRSWGMTATTNAGGAKYWQESFNEDLAGCDVIICNDNDDAGRQRATLRGAGLKPSAKSVRVLDLARHWTDMPEKADVSDWKEKAGGSAEKFAELVSKAPAWKPERPKSRFGAFTWDELDAPGREQEYIVEGWWTERGRSVIGGPSKSGKSFLAIHLAMCIARGQDFFDMPVKRGGVIYQAGEGGWGIKKRFKAYRKHFEVPDDEDIPVVPMTSKIDLYDRNGDTQPFIDEIKQWKLVIGWPLRMVVIDTLSTATAGADENSGKDMSVVLAHIARIEEECGVHVCLVHHMNADGKKLRGHTSIYANVDQVVLVTNNAETKIRSALLDKQKDDEDGLNIRFTLASVPIGHNEKTGRDVTSCVVLTVSEKERLKKEQARQGFTVNPTERRILMNLFDAVDRYGQFVATSPEDGPRAALGKTVVHWDRYREVAMEKMIEIEDRKKATEHIRKEFTRAKDGLVRCGIIGLNQPYMWWTGKPVRGFPRTFPSGQTAENWRTDGGQTASEQASPGMAEALQSEDGLLL